MQRVEFLTIISFVGVLIASGSLALIYAEPHVSEPYVLKTPPPAPDTYLITFTGETRIQSGTNKYQGVATFPIKFYIAEKTKSMHMTLTMFSVQQNPFQNLAPIHG